MHRTLNVCLFVTMLAVFVAGCGGSGDQAAASLPAAGSYVDIEAVPGPIVAAGVGETVILDDRKSYAVSNEPLSYHWSFSHKPYGSQAVLQDASSSTPSFTADVAGVYMLQLVVSAQGVTSQRAVTSVVVNNDIKITGPFNHQGLSSNCVNCHNDDFNTILSKSLTHLGTSNTCQTCHTPQGFAIIPVVDHQEVFGDCSQCHNGVLAIGKSEFHQPTEAECDDCHNTTAFLELNPDGSFDHTSISRSCSGCHNGTVAIGKHESHVPTDSECGYCHTVASFLGAYPDHTGPAVVGAGITCDSCHGVSPNDQPSDPPVGHPIVNVDCDTCHSIVSFSMPGGVFNHSLVDPAVQPCESCHTDGNSINATVATPTVTHQSTTEDCGACHNTESFAGAFIDHFGPQVVGKRCDSCHGVTASGKPLSTPFYEHMPTSEDCGVCHTPGTFSTGTYDHAGVISGCNACHNGIISVGLLSNHIPTGLNQDCADCHDTTSFTGAIFNHSGINTSNCSMCHDGHISVGKPVNHLPTGLDCSFCHDTGNYSSFAGIIFNHAGIDHNDCASCHNTGIATSKPAGHIPAQGECSVCHNSTAVFTSTTFLTSVHQGITRGCEGCHNGQFSTVSGSLYGKPGNHLPTAQDCDLCHTVAGFTPSTFAHTGISGNCESCHDGSVNNAAVGAIGKAQAPNPHPATTADCGACHAIGNNFTDGAFDHTGIVNNCSACHGDTPTSTPVGPGKNAGHLPTTQDCSFCHVPGTFVPAVFDHTGIVNNCASCHDGTAATGMSQGHLPTTQDCSVCHVTTAFAGASFDHKGIVSNCASCHNGTTAPGKSPPPDHVPTNDDCSACHVTTGFLPATFDHSGIVGNCSSCHNNVFATGKSGSHVLTNQDCGVCHNTTSFIGAVFDHTGIVDNCASCHDGTTARGKHSTHVATSTDCHFCHTTATFVGGSWFHDPSTAGQCDTCHSPGNGARSKPSGHLSTTVQCDACHSTNAWAPDIFSHAPYPNYPGDHRVNPGCSACHGSPVDNTLPYPHPQYAPPQRNTVYCAACHANDFQSQSDHIGGRSGTVEQNKDCSGGGRGCHRVTDSNFD